MLKTFLSKLKPRFRTISVAETDRIDHYIDTYHRLLSETGQLSLDCLEAEHRVMTSSLHRGADSKEVMVSAFIYSCLRLPDCIDQVQRIIMGASENSFSRHRIEDILSWEPVSARSRKRKSFFNGKDLLAVMVSSVSDVDDFIPALCAFQIEWNKMHSRLRRSPLGPDLIEGRALALSHKESLKSALNLSTADLDLLIEIWAERFNKKIAAMAGSLKNFQVRLLPIGPQDYEREVRKWWQTLQAQVENCDLEDRPLYLVSSNTHCLANIISGFALTQRKALVTYTLENGREGLLGKWERLRGEEEDAKLNFYYYAQRSLVELHPDYLDRQTDMETEAGVRRIRLPESETQLIDLSRIRPERLDLRLNRTHLEALKRSRAVILNLDYPLGFSAYQVMGQVADRVKALRGVHLMGKAAGMIGRVGDIMIPSVVQDAHTLNCYHFKNCFSVRQVVKYIRSVAVFENQQSVTVRGTFLHNWDSMKHQHRQDFTGIEMEAGPYLSALYEHFHSVPAPGRQIVHLKTKGPFDIGILHYTSDTPYNLRASLLSKRMGYTGLEATYACALSILQSIFQRELFWLR